MTNKVCFIIASILFGGALLLEVIGASQFRHVLAFAGLTFLAAGHAL